MEENASPLLAHPVPPRFLALLLLLFVGSGCSALIYEIVWFQMLQLVIGSSAVSLGVLLSTFMGGMCLGSLGFARAVSVRRHPLRVYALLELAIGCLRAGVVVSAAFDRAAQLRRRGPRDGGTVVPWRHLRRVPAATDGADGGDASGDCPVDGDHATRCLAARLLLRGQHRRRGARLPAGRFLSVEDP